MSETEEFCGGEHDGGLWVSGFTADEDSVWEVESGADIGLEEGRIGGGVGEERYDAGGHGDAGGFSESCVVDGADCGEGGGLFGDAGGEGIDHFLHAFRVGVFWGWGWGGDGLGGGGEAGCGCEYGAEELSEHGFGAGWGVFRSEW